MFRAKPSVPYGPAKFSGKTLTCFAFLTGGVLPAGCVPDQRQTRIATNAIGLLLPGQQSRSRLCRQAFGGLPCENVERLSDGRLALVDSNDNRIAYYVTGSQPGVVLAEARVIKRGRPLVLRRNLPSRRRGRAALRECHDQFVWRSDRSPLWVLAAGAVAGAVSL